MSNKYHYKKNIFRPGRVTKYYIDDGDLRVFFLTNKTRRSSKQFYVARLESFFDVLPRSSASLFLDIV